MKIVKKITIWLIAIIVLIFIVSFFLPSSVYMEREITIKAEAETVFNQINNLGNLKNWSPWYDIDTATVYTFNDIPEGVGASYKWESDNRNVMSGIQTIVKSKPFEYVETELDFMRGDISLSGHKLKSLGDSVNVVWWFSTDFSNPLQRYFGLIFDKMLGPDYEKGLQNLKNYCEKMPETSKFEVELVEFPGQIYIGIKEKCAVQEIGMKMGEFYGELMEFVQKSNIKMTNPPFSIYYSEPTDSFEFAACIPVENKIKTVGRIKFGEIKKGQVAFANYFGDYKKITEAHKSLKKWITQNNKTIVGPPWEEYITDPTVEKDTAKWLTKVYYPVE